jgi:hypothetical protein
MGIRVHKFLGYGLTDVKPKDERINWESWLLTYEDAPEPEAYLAWLEARQDERRFSLDYAHLKHLPPSDGKWHPARSLEDCAVWRDEYGLPEVLALRPFGLPDWCRFDDTIDYMEETYPWTDQSQQNRVKIYEHGPFPFNGAYMDKRDGRVLPPEIMTWWRLVNDAKDGEEKAKALDLFAVTCGFTSSEEAAENVRPEVPDEIRDLAEFGQLFTHAGIWRQLRPLLYTYWA